MLHCLALRGGSKGGYQARNIFGGSKMKFNMSKAWSGATAMIGANRELLMVVAGLFFFLPAVASTMILPIMPEEVLQSPDLVQQYLLQMFADYWWALLLVNLAQMLGLLTLLALLRDTSQPTVGEAISIGLKALIPYFVAYLLATIVISLIVGVLIALGAASGIVALAALGGILGFAFLAYAMVKLSLIGPVVAIDRVFNPIAAMRQSWVLTKGNSGRLFAFYLLIGIVYIVLTILIGGIAGLLFAALGDSSLGNALQGIVSGLLGAVMTVVIVSVLASVHKQLSGKPDNDLGETFG